MSPHPSPCHCLTGEFSVTEDLGSLVPQSCPPRTEPVCGLKHSSLVIGKQGPCQQDTDNEFSRDLCIIHYGNNCLSLERHTHTPLESYLNWGCLSQQQVIKNSSIITIQIHQFLMSASFCNTALFHEDHFITVSQVLETKTGTM